jgi:predicted dehydrogenase
VDEKQAMDVVFLRQDGELQRVKRYDRVPANRLLFAHREPLSNEEVPCLICWQRRRVNVVAVGCGARLTVLLKLLRSTFDLDVCLMAVCDANSETFQFQESDESPGAVPWANVPRFTHLDQMLSFIQNVDWVLIGSKNVDHLPHIETAWNFKKHVFCEKPIAITIPDCLKLFEEFRELSYTLRFATGFVLRCSMFYRKLKQLVDSGSLGKIVSVQANEMLSAGHGGYIMRNWRRFMAQAGPHILEKCCHDLDILLWILGSVPVRVSAFGGRNVFVPSERPSDLEQEEFEQTYCGWTKAWENVDPFNSGGDIEDNVVAILEFENGVHACFHSNACTAFPQRRLDIYGTRGSVQADLISGRIEVRTVLEHAQGEPPEIIECGARGMHGGADIHIIRDLHRCMLTECAPAADARDGLRGAVTCLAIDKARQEGTVLDLKPIWARLQ